MSSSPKDIHLVVFDFDGVFTDNSVYVFEDGREAVRCSRLDGIGLAKLTKLGINTMILSSEKNQAIPKRAEKLKIEYIHGSEDKLKDLRSVIDRKGFALSQVAFVGNDINDEDCLKAVGLPITVADAHPDVINLGKYITKINGGYGAVREVCDWFVSSLKESND